MKTKFIYTLTVLCLSQISLAHPLEGIWKFKSMHCSSAPAKTLALKPVPFSDFSPDMTLSFSFHEAINEIQAASEDATVVPLDSTKSLTTQSCSNPTARAIPGVFFRQVYHQKAHFNSTNEEQGTLTGDSLGISGQVTAQPISAADCDTMLGLMQWLFGNSHVEGELARVYDYSVEGTQLTLEYHDTLVGSQCDENDETVLVFEQQSF